MKLHSNITQKYQTVTGYDEHSVELNGIRYEHSLIVLPEILPRVWNVQDFAELNQHHFEEISTLTPDVVILGTGAKQQFIHPKFIQIFSKQHKGVECMDNHAACRTYNILMAEGRKVALALIFNSPSPL
jgi:uncharacterized protein